MSMSVLPVCKYVHICAWCPKGQNGLLHSSGTGIIKSSEPSCVYQELNLGTLQKQQVFFIIQPAPQVANVYINKQPIKYMTSFVHLWICSELTNWNCLSLLKAAIGCLQFFLQVRPCEIPLFTLMCQLAMNLL